MSNYIIENEQIKTRLDKFLVEKYPDFSRSQIKKFIESGKVKVGGKEVSAHYFLKLGDQVEAELGDPQKLMVAENPDVQFEIIHEEEDFLVINKPAGLVVHQGEGHNASDTLVNGLLARYKDCPSAEGQSFSRIGDDPIRPGIVHRLDGEVSGVMVIAKTQDMYDHLKQQFKRHEVEKEYAAIVEGKVSPAQGVIDFPIDRKEGKMVARAKGQEGKMAVTEYEVVPFDSAAPQGSAAIGRGQAFSAATPKKTLLKIITRTGRTHQIRVHLKAKGWPIAGDDLYKSKIKDKKSKTSGTEHLMLHARKLSFKDLSGQMRTFIVEAPTEFAK